MSVSSVRKKIKVNLQMSPFVCIVLVEAGTSNCVESDLYFSHNTVHMRIV